MDIYSIPVRESLKSPSFTTGESPFSPDYATARRRFRNALPSSGKNLISLPLNATDGRGRALTIDVAWFGDENPRRVFIHSSGLHGVEGFSGSAIQLQWLWQGLCPIPPDSAVVLAHVLNPYGMERLRRCNESNVDLNRNFREAGSFTPAASHYWDAVNAVLNPVSLHRVDPFYLQAVWLLMRCGMPTLRHAVAGGQFQNPGGLFFGGTALEEGPAKLQSLMKERLSRAERVVAIDIHTGLGRYGEDRLLVDSAPQHASANQAMLQAYGDRMQLLNNASIAYPIRGAQQDMYYRLCPQAQVLFATQEFGTYHPLRVVKALRDENFWHSRGSSLDHPTKKTLVEMFNPADAKWRKTILSRGGQVINQGLALAFAGS